MSTGGRQSCTIIWTWHGIYNVMPQCPVTHSNKACAFSLNAGLLYCVGTGSSLDREIIRAFAFTSNCCNNGAFPKDAVYIKFLPEVFNICLCYFHRQGLRYGSNKHQYFTAEAANIATNTGSQHDMCMHRKLSQWTLPGCSGRGQPVCCVTCHLCSCGRILVKSNTYLSVCETGTFLSYFKWLL